MIDSCVLPRAVKAWGVSLEAQREQQAQCAGQSWPRAAVYTDLQGALSLG